MIDVIVQAIAAIVALPPEVIAMAAGTMTAWGITQRAKFLIPSRWSPKARELATQATAFAIGAVTTTALFPAGPWAFGAVAGLLVGLWSPALWNIGMFFIGLRWPALRERLSQENRDGA